MNSLDQLNIWGNKALAFAWPMLWQSSLLIAVLFLLDLGLRRKVRANVRYALWLVLLVKMLLPPSLAFPSGVAWWLRPAAPHPTFHGDTAIQVVYGAVQASSPPKPSAPEPTHLASPALSLAGWAGVCWILLSLVLLVWTLLTCRRITREIRLASKAPEWLQELFDETRHAIGLPCRVRLKLLERCGSPTVSGLVHPTVLVPRAFLVQLTKDQLRLVFLHELIHVRRGDPWINCAQALVQVFYCWHPLLWLANARMRHVREEGVDEAVMLALGSRSGTYAPTLLEVAKVALQRQLANFGPIGILESRSFLRRRIERLLDFRPPTRRLTLISALSVLAFAAMALPMGEAPPSANEPPAEKERTQAPVANDALSIEQPFQPLPARSPGGSGAGIFQSTNGTLLKYGSLRGSADRMTAVISNQQLLSIVADGHVRLEQDKQVLQSDHVQISPLGSFTAAAVFGEDHSAPGELSQAAHHSGLGVFGYDQSYRANLKDGAPAAIDQVVTNASKSATPAHSPDYQRVMTLLKRESVDRRLRDIRVPSVSFHNLPLRTVVARLNDYVPEKMSGEKDLVFSYDREPYDLGDVRITIEPALKDISLVQLVEAVAKVAPRPLTYSITETGVVFTGKVGPNQSPRGAQDQASAQINIKTKFITLPEDAIVSLRSLWSTTNLVLHNASNIVSVLTPAQSAVLAKAVQSNPRVDLFREASVTTLSGRETEVEVVDLKTIVTNLNPQALTRPGIFTKANATNGLYQMTTIPFGPTLDSVASILGDGHHIELSADVKSMEFLGYDDPKTKVPAYIDGKRTYTVRPLPHFRQAKVAATVVIPDGHTLLLGARMIDEPINAVSPPKNKRLVVLLTPTLIDPAGNRLHPETEPNQSDAQK